MLKSYARDMLTYLPSKLLPALTGFISAPILTRLFLPEEYANYALALGFSDFLFALAISGLSSVSVRFYPAYKADSEHGVFFGTLSGSVGIVIVVVGAATMGVLWLLRGVLPGDLYPLFRISVLIFAIQAVYDVFMGVLRVQERSGLYTGFELIVRYGSLGLGLFLVVVLGFGVDGLLWGFLLALALTLPFLLSVATRGVRLHRRDIRARDASKMWQYAWPLALGNMAMWGLRLSDRYILSFFRPESEVGLYSVAYNLSSKSIDILVALFLLSMGPMLMNIWESRGRESTEKAQAAITRLYLVLCLPAAAGLSLLAKPFVALLTAEGYHDGYRIVGYVAFSSFAWGLAQVAGMGILIKQRTKLIAASQFLAVLVNLGLNLVLIPRFGFVAAGLTTLIGYLVLLVLQTYASRPHLTWRFPGRTLRNVVISTVCMGLVICGVYGASGDGGGVHVAYLFMSAVAAILVYFAALWLVGEANEEEKAWLKRFWRRMRPAGTESRGT